VKNKIGESSALKIGIINEIEAEIEVGKTIPICVYKKPMGNYDI